MRIYNGFKPGRDGTAVGRVQEHDLTRGLGAEDSLTEIKIK